MKGELAMSKTIDLHDLPEDEVNLVKDFVSYLKGRLKVKHAPFMVGHRPAVDIRSVHRKYIR